MSTDANLGQTDGTPGTPEVKPAVSKRVCPEAFKPFFAKGHARLGGRQKGVAVKGNIRTSFDAIATARRLNFDPIETMIQVVQHGSILEPDGSSTPVEMPERMKMLREVAPYVVSKAPTEVKGEVHHRHLGIDVSEILANPQLAAAAENLALALLEQEQQEDVLEAEVTLLPDPDSDND